MILNLPHDKALHLISGLFIYTVAHFISPVVGLVAVAIAAIGKEVYDWFHRDKHTPEVLDAVATMLGGLAGYICSL